MLNFLVETKQEYTTQLINILTPLIFEGLQSIYNEASSISTTDNVLRNFQLFLKRIPKWNNEIIIRETERIMNNSKSYSWLEDLIKATIKANIIVLTYNPSIKSQVKTDPIFYQNIKIYDFIHKIYIECARELWNNPYLFYHLFLPIELKRNQRDAYTLIKDCIKEAIRKLLPVKHILQIYLGEEMENSSPDDKFENSISEVEEKNLSKLIKKDLAINSPISVSNNNIIIPLDNKIMTISENNIIINHKDLNKNIIQIKKEEEKKEINNKTNEKNHNNNSVGSQILNIINNKNMQLTDKNDSIISKTSEKKIDNNVDSKIKNILNNDLNESETSISHNINDKYHEIFSNSIDEKKISESVNTNSNSISNNKNKFFKNYLQI